MRQLFKYSVLAASCAMALQAQAAMDCSDIPAWDKNVAYDGGALVKNDSVVFKANWWTKGNNPATHSGDYMEWSRIDMCSDGPTDPEVPNKAPSVSFTAPANGSEYAVGEKVAIRVNAADEDGVVAKVVISVAGQPIAELTQAPFTANWTAVEGQQQIHVVATDDDGATASAGIMVSVKPEVTEPEPGDVIPFIPGQTQVKNGDVVLFDGQCFIAKNNPGVWETPAADSWFWDVTECPGEPGEPEPTELSILTPIAGQVLKANIATSIQAKVDGELAARIEFWVNNQKLSQQVISQSQTHYSQSWTPAVEGSASVEVLVFDTKNQKIEQKSVSVTVEADTEEDFVAPVVRFIAPGNGESVGVKETLAIVVNATDADDDLTTLVVKANNSQICSFDATGSATYVCDWQPTQEGAVTLQAVATDAQGLFASQSVGIKVEAEEEFTAPVVAFLSPGAGASFNETEMVAVAVNATDVDEDLTTVVINANNQQICSFDATQNQAFACNWQPTQVGNISLKAIATDAEGLTASVSRNITIKEDEPPVIPPGGLCADFNVYPDWTRGDHATGGDVMVHNNIAYSAIYWTQSVPGSDASWALHLNCDGTEPGTAPLLSLQNPMDPIRLEVTGWPNTFVVASPSTNAPATLDITTSNTDALADINALTDSFVAVMRQAEQAGKVSIIINSDVLDKATSDKGASLGTIAVKQALLNAIDATGNRIDIDAINELSDDLKGWAQAHQLIIATLAPQATFGWSLSIGDFAYDTHSGRQSVWDKASVFSADLIDTLALYKLDATNKADFLVFTKSGSTPALSDDQWHNALEYVKQVTDYVKTPAMLANMPTAQAADYFMGTESSQAQIRKAAYSNVFALMFDQDSEALTQKIERYQSAKMPLYYVGETTENGKLTSIDALNDELANAEEVMNNTAFLYETPQSQWVPSTVYKWADFMTGLNAMHNVGVAGNKFWLLDENADDATNIKYAKVAIAAFLAQSMQETIRYNACDENNWAEIKYGAPTDYPMTASCGQLEQKYADYGVNPESGLDHAYSCPRDNKMELSAQTHAKWYGAPAPVFAAPDAVLQERGLLVNGAVGRWTNNGHCNDVPTAVDTSKQVWERDDCKTYVGQKAGKFIWDGSSQDTVEGCGWWGRGVIQTTGRQNFGTLNHYLGRSHVDPDTIGQTIDGVTVEAPPANPLYAELDFCSNPGLICSSEENKEIKWIAGLFYWVTSVQAYDNAGGQYADWNYYRELKKYVDGGLQGSSFIDDVSGIVNRGCPDLTCSTGEVHNVKERRANFKLVLEQLGLEPK
ncbi:Ig-like domain-containing protein [Shewanella submarina]|uniref:Ig-like domain-containing protein n=1 Tax=Shewanella submarina TaxID=2016376 RepID=A0ABV7GCZ2_9GAMM|nr:Ig-like domain-containing protein [Shewanella submarina]MCL1039150.1 Ig-like domain-containing protein [Shewanella submarina]